MSLSIKSIGRTVIFTGLFFGLLFVINFGFKNFLVADQFERELVQVNGVKAITVTGDKEINLSLEHAANIKQVYQDIDKILGEKQYTIVLKDKPTDVLKNISEKSEIAVQEAIVRGNYTDMEDRINRLAEKSGVTVKMHVDEKRVYLQFEKGGSYLYHVVERPETVQDGSDRTT